MRRAKRPSFAAWLELRHRERGEIHVSLAEGFLQDDVELLLDGETIFRHPLVTTNEALGVAASIEATVPKPVMTLTVRVASRRLTASVQVRAQPRPVYVVISIEPEGLLCRLAARPAGYL